MLRPFIARALTRTSVFPLPQVAQLRSFAASTSRLESDQGTLLTLRIATDPAAPAYPFAQHVVTCTHSAHPENSVRAPPPQVNHPSRGVMPRVDAQLTSEIDPDERIARLFSRRSPECVPPGSIMMVESYLTPAKTSTTTFAGVLIAVRRAGIATSFVLRTIAHKLGVEMNFSAYSPMIKDIRVIERADARKGERGLLRTRQAKPYYMRRRDDRRVNSVANVVKQFRAAELHRADGEARDKASKK